MKLFVVGAAVLALAAGGVAAAGPTWAGSTPPKAPPIDPRHVASSVEYLRRTYGVSEQEALRRLELQATAHRLAGTLAARAPRSYGGMWLDQANGGRLVVAATAPADVAKLVAAAPDRGHITVTKVARSLADLTALRQRLSGQLGAGPDSVYLPEVSQPANQVVVWRRDWLAGKQPLAAQSTVDKITAGSAGAVVVRSKPKPNQLTTKGDVGNQCFMLYCTGYGAMRGGLRLEIPRDPGQDGTVTIGGCTSGFNIRASGGAYDGRAFVLTGGHCVNSARHTHLDTAYHEGVPVLREVPDLAVNNFPLDYALLPYVDAAIEQTWMGGTPEHNLVLEWCRNGGLDSDADTWCQDGDQHDDGREHITNVLAAADVVEGAVVCATGAGSSSLDYTDAIDSGAGQGYKPGTRCGRVSGQSNGALDTDLCARAGDSGGPLFDQTADSAIGILEGNTQDRSGRCQVGESNNYIPISSILAAVNGTPAALGSTFGVITTPAG